MTKRLIALLALLCLLSPTPARTDTVVLIGFGAAAGATTVKRFFAAVQSEPAPAWTHTGPPDGNIQYSHVFADNSEFSLIEGDKFDVIGAAGQLCNLSITQKGGTLDLADTDAVVTLRIITGGDVSGGGWADTALSRTITSDDTTTDVAWTDSDCVTVAAGDAVALKWDLVAVGSPYWAGGEFEAPEVYIEFTSTNANESFNPNSLVQASQFQSEYYWSIAGDSTEVDTDDTKTHTPLPGDFTLTGLFVSFEANPGTQTTVYVCEAGVGAAAECNGTGTIRMSCPIETTGVSTCSSTSCLGGNCDFVAGDRLYMATTLNVSNNLRAVGLRFTNASRRWWSGVSGMGPSLGAEVEKSMSGRTSTSRCNGGTAEDPQCMIRMVSGATAIATQGWMAAVLSAGTYDVSARETGVDAAVNCLFSSGSQTCSETATEVFDAGDYFNMQETPAGGAADGGNLGVTILWESM